MLDKGSNTEIDSRDYGGTDFHAVEWGENNLKMRLEIKAVGSFNWFWSFSLSSNTQPKGKDVVNKLPNLLQANIAPRLQSIRINYFINSVNSASGLYVAILFGLTHAELNCLWRLWTFIKTLADFQLNIIIIILHIKN